MSADHARVAEEQVQKKKCVRDVTLKKESWVSVLNRMIKVGLILKVRFEQTFDRGEEISQPDIMGKSIPGKGNNQRERQQLEQKFRKKQKCRGVVGEEVREIIEGRLLGLTAHFTEFGFTLSKTGLHQC